MEASWRRYLDVRDALLLNVKGPMAKDVMGPTIGKQTNLRAVPRQAMLTPAQAENIADCARRRCLASLFSSSGLSDREAETAIKFSAMADKLALRYIIAADRARMAAAGITATADTWRPND